MLSSRKITVCDRCVWQRAVPLMQKLLDSGRLGASAGFVFSTLQWVKSNRHITRNQLGVLERLEKKAGIKKPADYYKLKTEVAGGS